MYKKLIPPPSADSNLHSRQVVLQWLLVGSIGLTIIAFINTLASFLVFRDINVVNRLALVTLVGSIFGALLFLSCVKHRHVFASFVLTSLFFVASAAVCYAWGTVNPMGLLLFGLTIVMAGILLSARSSLYVVILSIMVLGFLEYAKDQHYFSPDVSWMKRPSDYSDIISFSAVFFVVALISWLFNRQMEHSLRRAQRSERALQLQKASLEIKVEERTRELQAAQLEKVQHFYRFAELGNLSTALFHDLGNHLSSVTLDIEGLQRNEQSQILHRIQKDVGYINDVVSRVRQQMQGKGLPTTFDIGDEIIDVMKILAFSAQRADVQLKCESLAAQPLHYKADVIRFRQLIINLLSNAIDACPPKTNNKKERVVLARIDFEPDTKTNIIQVIDHGVGIPVRQQHKIFEPFYSTKEKGSGIGLFIVKQVVEKDFKGTISLVSGGDQGTTFTVRLPG